MNRKYNLKLDLQFRCNNSIMKFNQFDNNTSDFFMRITNGGNLVDIEKALVVLAVIKPSGKVASQFVEVKNGIVYADLKPSMKDEIGTYTAKAMLILEDERVVTDAISYEVEEDKIFSLLNDTVGTSEEFTLLTDMLSRLSTIEISEEQRMINEAERILSEENRKIEEAKRVEAELIRQHEEADRAKYDATRESNENIRKINEEARTSSENVRLENEANRIEQETNRVKAEQLRKDNYNFMTEDEERRRLEANAHKEAEKLRAQAETNRVNEEAKRRTTEQARVSAENTRVSNENTRKANETTRQNNETQRVEAETQRQNRYNSFIADAETNANNFENYTNNAKIKEEERKSNELNRKSQEDRRVSNEVERISNENTRKANEKARQKNETSRQNIFENKVDEVDKKIVEINTTKDNFVSSISTKVDTKISEIDTAKSDMTTTVSNKVKEVETRFNALTSKQQQDAEVIDARDGETSLKARLDRDIEKAKQVYMNVEGSNISTDSSVGYAKDVEILGNTIQSASNLADIKSVGDKVEGQELYEIPVLSVGKNLFDGELEQGAINEATGGNSNGSSSLVRSKNFIKIPRLKNIRFSNNGVVCAVNMFIYNSNKKFIRKVNNSFTLNEDETYVRFYLGGTVDDKFQLEEGTQATPYEPYIEDKLTILSPTPLEKVGDVADKLIEKDGVWGVEKWTTVKQIPNNLYWMVDSYDSETTNSFWCNATGFGAIGRKRNEKSLYHKKLNSITRDEFEFSDTIGISTITNGGGFFIKTPKNVTVGTVNNYIAENGYEIICTNNTPQFIPLPHDQQVKLRTFANKTNISFLTEIEGTIKAQVPKSIGATVNTHTEQINNLNKELDRVKKLEESTVSTVTTESDFTTVEATSGGYFEDVKLEGKTLVNLMPNTTTISGSSETQTTNTFWFSGDMINNNLFKPNTKYSVIFYNKHPKVVRAYFHLASQTTVDIINNVAVFTTPSIIEATKSVIHFYTSENVAIDEVTQSNIKAIILEGDHTQNPPSGYIEGLKSVGQDVDEIVVSSCNNVKEFKYDKKVSSLVYDFDITDIVSNNFDLFNPFNYKLKVIINNAITNEWKRDVINLGHGVHNIKLNDDEKVIKVRGVLTDGWHSVNSEDFFNKICFSYNFKQDKKRLLYYNEETQAWEKPILREWDSIEKHADGKYYYHQRSGEVVLNGSENITIYRNDDTLNTIAFAVRVANDALISSAWGNCICLSDKFNTINMQPVYVGIDKECATISNNTNQGVIINISRNKLSTQDIQGFKQWLQANNVTVVYQLAQEKVYECTNIDLITYANETNYVVNSGAISPKTTLKVHNNISNVVSLLQKKVSLLESDVTSYMITQNRLMLASRYNADNVTFKVDYPSMMSEREVEIDYDLFKLIQDNIIVGPENYDVDKMLEIMDLYAMIGFITWEMWDYLYEVIDSQINPVIGDLEGAPEI